MQIRDFARIKRGKKEHTKKKMGGNSMKTYKVVLIAILVITCAVCAWYCYSAYNEQRSTEKGTLVYEEWAGNCIY